LFQNLQNSVDMDHSNHAEVDGSKDMMDITLAAEIKEELFDDADADVADVEMEDDDDDDVVIVDTEKTMQYLSGVIYSLFTVMWQ